MPAVRVLLRALLAWALLLGALAPRSARGGHVTDVCVGLASVRAAVDASPGARAHREVATVHADLALPPTPLAVAPRVGDVFELSFAVGGARRAETPARVAVARGPPIDA